MGLWVAALLEAEPAVKQSSSANGMRDGRSIKVGEGGALMFLFGRGRAVLTLPFGRGYVVLFLGAGLAGERWLCKPRFSTLRILKCL